MAKLFSFFFFSLKTVYNWETVQHLCSGVLSTWSTTPQNRHGPTFSPIFYRSTMQSDIRGVLPIRV